jgi:hypothetical protein
MSGSERETLTAGEAGSRGVGIAASQLALQQMPISMTLAKQGSVMCAGAAVLFGRRVRRSGT